MSSPPRQNLRPLAQLQRLPVDTKVAVLSDAIPSASPAEAVSLGLALVECATDYSETQPSGSALSRGIQSLFRGLSRPSRRDPDRALGAIVRVWSHLPAEVRALAAVAGKGRWSKVTGTLATDQNPTTRRSVAELARGAGDPGLGGIACELLADQDEQVAAGAERALCFLALVASDPALAAWTDHANVGEHEEASRVRAQWSIADRERICADLAMAVRGLATHRREGVLWGALLLLDPCVVRGSGPVGGAQLARWITDREQSSHSFLRGLLRRDASPLSRLRAWQWLGTTAVTGAAADRVLAARTLDEHEALYSAWHLMLNPSRLAKFRQSERGAKAVAKAGLFPSPEVTERLSIEGRVGVAAISRGLGMAAGARDGVCEPLLSDPEPTVRLGASIACSSRMLGDFCLDACQDVARSAALRASFAAIPDASRSPGAERVEQERARLRILAKSPHEQVRRLAITDLELLCDGGSLGTALGAASRVAYRRALESDRAWVLERLRAMLSQSEESRSLALQLARKLGVVIELRDPVLAEIRRMLREPMSSAAPARSLATAVATLREFPGEEPLRLLKESSAFSDQRVRANALDALAIRARDGIDSNTNEAASTLLEFKEDSWHRVRGSAVRGLELIGIRASEVGSRESIIGEQLLKMLEDSRPQHRLAGAWVADRTLPGRTLREMKLWPNMMARLRALALTDLEPRVRMRAKMALMRSGEPRVRGEGPLVGNAA
ncbi:MAG: hypothetical protein KF691_11085 [Phycisphaeraceae bacterium]|nr:hypothetical protein [Phycisphaeraceae bacterium]